NLTDYTFSGNCSSGAPDATQSCFRGSFDPKGPLIITTFDARTNTTNTLESVNKIWSHEPHYDDAPDFLIRDVISPRVFGQVVLETVVTNHDDCTSLKLCAFNASDPGVVAAVALTLYHQSKYASYCTSPVVN